MQMRKRLKQGVWVVALVLSIGISGATVRAVAAPQPQDQHQDYTNNRAYQQGMKDGKDDRAHNRDHYHKRHYKKDEDSKAYEAGYQSARNAH